MKKLVRLVIGEEVQVARLNKLEDIIQRLWGLGFPGLTVRRMYSGIDNEPKLVYKYLEDEVFNNLPMVFDMVVSDIEDSFIERLKEQFDEGQINIFRSWEEKDMNTYDHYNLKIFTKYDNEWFKQKEYEKILNHLKNHEVIWCTVNKGIAGFGKDRNIYVQKFFETSKNAPLIIECIVSNDNLNSTIKGLDELINEGSVFATPIHNILNK